MKNLSSVVNIPENLFEHSKWNFIGAVIMAVIMFLPIIALLIYSIIDPESVGNWGWSFSYKEKPELTEGAIRYIRASSIMVLVLIASLMIIFINAFYGMIFFVVSIGGGMYYFLTKE